MDWSAVLVDSTEFMTDFALLVGRVRGSDAEQLVVEAAHILREHKIDQVPVVDEKQRPIGLLDVQDLLSTRVF